MGYHVRHHTEYLQERAAQAEAELRRKRAERELAAIEAVEDRERETREREETKTFLKAVISFGLILLAAILFAKLTQ